METIWCSEFAALQAMVSKTGGAVSIEKALAAGEAPMKVVELAGADDAHLATTGTRASTRRMG
jgi:hypothetical protein